MPAATAKWAAAAGPTPGRAPICPRAARARKSTSLPYSEAWYRLESGLRIPGGEAVAGAAHGLHEPLQQMGLERLAQAADVHVHSTLLDVSIAAPHPVEQLAAAEHPLRVGHEE